MAETKEREKREKRPAGFTDGDYIPHNEAPNMPRVFSNGDSAEPKEPERRMIPLSLGVLLSTLTLFVGLWLGSQGLLSEDAAEERAAGTRPAQNSLPLASARREDMDSYPEVNESGVGLGIFVQTVSPAAAGYYRLFTADGQPVEGVQICALGEDSPAEDAGLQAGDILTALDGAAVRSARELSAAEGRYKAGERAVCSLYREGETLELTVVFRNRSPEDQDYYW